jgi:hypothetical protein
MGVKGGPYGRAFGPNFEGRIGGDGLEGVRKRQGLGIREENMLWEVPGVWYMMATS